MRNWYFIIATFIFSSAYLFADQYKIGYLTIDTPQDWLMHQHSTNNNIEFLAFSKDGDYIRFYMQKTTNLDLKSLFNNNSQIVRDTEDRNIGNNVWQVMETKMTYRLSNNESPKINYVTAFYLEHNNIAHYGYAKAKDADQARAIIETFLQNTHKAKSLTDETFAGKKYYFGFAEYLSGFMGNEAKFDVKHTNDIFVNKIGGDYEGTALIDQRVDGRLIKDNWTTIKNKITEDDMYVQYSSGHGYGGGLGVGVTYNEIRDNALSYPAKEIIIFIMSCYAGSLVNSFNDKKDLWEHWGDEGRTLLVLASSRAQEESSTGPGTDPDQPNSPNGSAGSAFGHALWKALIGYSDGFIDGVKDGFISLEEIIEFSIWKTRKIGGHTPVYTGTFNANLIMNRVPSKEFLDSLPKDSSGATDENISLLMQQLPH